MAIGELLQVAQQVTGVPDGPPYVRVPLEQLLRLVELAAAQTTANAELIDPAVPGAVRPVRLGHEFRAVWRHALPGQPADLRTAVSVEDLLLLR